MSGPFFPRLFQMIQRGILVLSCAAHVPGCGILMADINEPELAYQLGKDPARITRWTLQRTDVVEISEGVNALGFVADRWPAKAADAHDGRVQIYEKLGAGWPGLTEAESRELRSWMRSSVIPSISLPPESSGRQPAAERDPSSSARSAPARADD